MLAVAVLSLTSGLFLMLRAAADRAGWGRCWPRSALPCSSAESSRWAAWAWPWCSGAWQA